MLLVGLIIILLFAGTLSAREILISCNDLPCNCEDGCGGNKSVNFGCQGNCKKLPTSSRFSRDTGWKGTGCTMGNLAYLKKTTQSSTFDKNTQSSNSVDGEFADSYASNYSQTVLEEAPWWMVDLENLSAIDYVEIYNRLNDNSEAHINIYVNVRVGNTSSIDNHTCCDYSCVSVSTNANSLVNCKNDVVGRYVSIQRSSLSNNEMRTLTLAEIVVMGRPLCDIDECHPNPCINGGTCVDDFSKYMCVCPDGFTGLNCEINVDECLSNTCVNGGTCVDGIFNYTCTCPAGFTGVYCEMSVYGTSCQTELDCISILQNTSCINGICSCKPGYFRDDELDYCLELELGDPCELDTDCKTAINNSVCIQGVCQCMQMYIMDTSASPAECRLIGLSDECQEDIQCSLALNSSACVHGNCECAIGLQYDVLQIQCVNIYWWVWLCVGMGVVSIAMVLCTSVILKLMKHERKKYGRPPILFSSLIKDTLDNEMA